MMMIIMKVFIVILDLMIVLKVVKMSHMKLEKIKEMSEDFQYHKNYNLIV